MKKLITLLLIFISSVFYSQTTPGVYTVKSTKINTYYSDFGTAFYGKNKVVFAAPKQGITFTRDARNNNNNNKQPFLDLFIGEITDDGEIIKKQKMPGDINTKYHEGMVSFSKDLKSVYFSANWYLKKKKKSKEKRKSTRNIQIFKANINEDGQWVDLTLLPFNSTQFSSGHPALNIDDTKLYFVSDRPESIGKTDIFVVDIYEDGTYSEPKNLGPKINTVEREMFPFISDDNILYFSSNGFPSYGELDVFASKIYDNTVSDPISLEAPINSEKDDFAYIINDENHKGYFSSNRKGGKGDDDVYAFTVSPPIYFECQQVISGVVKDIHTQEIIPEALIVLFDEQGIKLQSIISNQNDGSFNFEQSCNTPFKIKGYLQGHLIGEMDIKTVNDVDVDPLDIVLNLDKSLVEGLIPDTDITETNIIVDEKLATDKTQNTKSNADLIANQNITPSENIVKVIADTDKILATDKTVSQQSKTNLVAGNNITDTNTLSTEKIHDSQTKNDFVADNNVIPNADVKGTNIVSSENNEALDTQSKTNLVNDNNIIGNASATKNNTNLASSETQNTKSNTDLITNQNLTPSENVVKVIADSDKILTADKTVSQQTKTNLVAGNHITDTDTFSTGKIHDSQTKNDFVTDNNAIPNADVKGTNIVSSENNEALDTQSKTNLVNDNNIIGSASATKTNIDTNNTLTIDKGVQTGTNPIQKNDINNTANIANNNTAQNSNISKTDEIADADMNSDLKNVKGKNIININTIYFDFDKYKIRYDAKIELDKIAEVLTNYPKIEIDVNSHTDSRGMNAYNYTLSNKRANETIQYLVNKGIDPNRISGKGYGELKLFEKCQNGVPCTNLQHQLNRRSEFTITQNDTNDITFKFNNISSSNIDANKFTSNSGDFINYNFDGNTEVYTVQVGAFKGNVQTNKFSKLTNLFNHKYNDGFNRYFVGIFETSTEARNYLKLLRKKGFEGAFVTGLNGDNKFY